jgi:hypothetical protein
MNLPARCDVADDTPLRLAVAARLFFPDGSITARSLEREAQRGRLEVMHIAGKTFTTLGALARMCAACRALSPRPVSTSDAPATTEPPPGSSSTAASKSAQARARMTSRKLKRRLPNTSTAAPDRPSAEVIPIKSS